MTGPLSSGLVLRLSARARGYCEGCGHPAALEARRTLVTPPEDGCVPACFALLCPVCSGREDRDFAAHLAARIITVEGAIAAGRFLPVAAAILCDEAGRVLAARRKLDAKGGSFWEFPGGKLEEGETLEDCLCREILEELGVRISSPERFLMTDHAERDRIIRLFSLRSRILAGKIDPRDHEEVRWVRCAELPSLDLAPADIPIASYLAAKVKKPC